MEKKLHIEIGIDGENAITRISGDGGELLTAATYVLNMFYRTFEKNGGGEAK